MTNENNITLLHDERTNTEYVRIDHKSGLTIYVCEMNGFHSTKALFGTKYGSINTCFKTVDETDYCRVPEGVAHFLEHKLFENQDGDVFQLYAKTGANANAYTSFEKTAYFFSCSDHYQESLEILLSFVQNPYFTAQSVAKEQGIIGQEIRMTQDDPEWRVFFNMLKGMYHEHPVKINIAGTEESIAQITDELLYRCYNTFYNLHNMVLCVTGNCKVDEVLAIADRLLKPCEPNQLELIFPNEPATVVRPKSVDYAPVGVPIFHFGIKCPAVSSETALRYELALDIALACISGSSSPLYHEMMAEGLINDTFGKSIFNGDGFFTIIYEGESQQVDVVCERIRDAICRTQETSLDPELFEVIRNSMYGDMIRDLGSPAGVSNVILSGHFLKVNPFQAFDMLSNLTVEECNRILREFVDPQQSVLSVVMNPTDIPQKGDSAS